jgi:CBS domain-containing protein
MGLLGQLPAPVEVLLGRLLPVQSAINTVCTNVPGPAGSRRLLGRSVREIHPVVPLFEALGLEFAILSYGGRLSITAAADAGLVADANALVPALERSFHELRAAALKDVAVETPRAWSCVGDLMTTPVVAMSPNDSFAAAWQVMHGERIRHLPVVDDELRLVGLVTHRDLLGHAPSDLQVARAPERFAALDRVRIGDLMERHVSTATPQEPLAEAGRRMLGAKIGCLPVIAPDGRLVGILTESDFVRWASSAGTSTRTMTMAARA